MENTNNFNDFNDFDNFFNKVNPARIVIIYVTIATWLIMMAFFMQIFFDIRPCQLCLWQRIPFYVVMSGAVLVPLRFVRFALVLQATAFFANIILSGYHSGIERKWWEGLNGCSIHDISGLSLDEFQQQLMNTAIVKCDEIAWSLFGLSLTNYNFILCSLLCFSSIYFIRGYDAHAKATQI